MDHVWCSHLYFSDLEQWLLAPCNHSNVYWINEWVNECLKKILLIEKLKCVLLQTTFSPYFFSSLLIRPPFPPVYQILTLRIMFVSYCTFKKFLHVTEFSLELFWIRIQFSPQLVVYFKNPGYNIYKLIKT